MHEVAEPVQTIAEKVKVNQLSRHHAVRICQSLSLKSYQLRIDSAFLSGYTPSRFAIIE